MEMFKLAASWVETPAAQGETFQSGVVTIHPVDPADPHWVALINLPSSSMPKQFLTKASVCRNHQVPLVVVRKRSPDLADLKEYWPTQSSSESQRTNLLFLFKSYYRFLFLPHAPFAGCEQWMQTDIWHRKTIHSKWPTIRSYPSPWGWSACVCVCADILQGTGKWCHEMCGTIDLLRILAILLMKHCEHGRLESRVVPCGRAVDWVSCDNVWRFPDGAPQWILPRNGINFLWESEGVTVFTTWVA